MGLVAEDIFLSDFYVRSGPSYFTRVEACRERKPQLFSRSEPVPEGRPHVPRTH